MEKIVIVGAGGFGREVLAWVREVRNTGKNWDIIGFVDDNPGALAGFDYDVPIIDTIKGYQPQAEHRLVLAMATPTRTKVAIADSLIRRGAHFLSLIHPTVVMGANVTYGVGCVLCPYVVTTCDITIGDFVAINCHAVIGHDAVLGTGSTLYSYANINGRARVGTGVEIGSHACLLPGARVGDFATVGAGSVVLKQVKPGATVMGVPAKRLLGS